jgi:hypothetical protein
VAKLDLQTDGLAVGAVVGGQGDAGANGKPLEFRIAIAKAQVERIPRRSRRERQESQEAEQRRHDLLSVGLCLSWRNDADIERGGCAQAAFLDNLGEAEVAS